MSKPNTLMDKVGVCASAICAVHCALTGAAMGFLAVAGLEFMANPLIEAGFVGMALIVGSWAVVHGLRKHHSKIPAAVFVGGLACIVASHFLGHAHSATQAGSPLATILAVIGGLSIAAFHFLNMRMQHKNCACGVARSKNGIGI